MADLNDDQGEGSGWSSVSSDERARQEPDNSERVYNLDDDKDRQDYMTARWEGQQFEDASEQAA